MKGKFVYSALCIAMASALSACHTSNTNSSTPTPAAAVLSFQVPQISMLTTQQLQFTLSNTGNAAASNIQISLSSGLSNTTVSPSSISSLAPGETAIVTLTTNNSSAAEGNITISATGLSNLSIPLVETGISSSFSLPNSAVVSTQLTAQNQGLSANNQRLAAAQQQGLGASLITFTPLDITVAPGEKITQTFVNASQYTANNLQYTFVPSQNISDASILPSEITAGETTATLQIADNAIEDETSAKVSGNIIVLPSPFPPLPVSLNIGTLNVKVPKAEVVDDKAQPITDISLGAGQTETITLENISGANYVNPSNIAVDTSLLPPNVDVVSNTCSDMIKLQEKCSIELSVPPVEIASPAQGSLGLSFGPAGGTQTISLPLSTVQSSGELQSSIQASSWAMSNVPGSVLPAFNVKNNSTTASISGLAASGTGALANVVGTPSSQGCTSLTAGQTCQVPLVYTDAYYPSYPVSVSGTLEDTNTPGGSDTTSQLLNLLIYPSFFTLPQNTSITSGGLASLNTQNVYIDGSGNAFVATDGGLNIRLKGQSTWYTFTSANQLPSNNILSTYGYQDDAGNVHVAVGTDNGLAIGLYTASSQSWTWARNPSGANFQYNNVPAVFGGSEKNIVYAVTGGQLYTADISDMGHLNFSSKGIPENAQATGGFEDASENLWLLTNGVLYKQAQGTNTWDVVFTPTNTTLRSVYAYTDSNNVEHIYVGANSGLYISNDGGSNFTLYSYTQGLGVNTSNHEGTIADPVNGVYVAINESNPAQNTVYAATAVGLAISTDNGLNWSPNPSASSVNPNATLFNTSVVSGVAVDSSESPSVVYAATNGGLEFGAGTTGWDQAPINGIVSNHLSSLAVKADSTGVNHIYAGSDKGLLVSNDSGRSWSAYSSANGMLGDQVKSVELDNEGNVYMAVASNPSLITQESGISIFNPSTGDWTSPAGAQGLDVNAAAGYVDSSTHIYAATNGGVEYSNNGDTFDPVVGCSGSVRSVKILNTSTAHYVVAASSDGLCFGSGGSTTIQADPVSSGSTVLFDVAVDSSNDRIYGLWANTIAYATVDSNGDLSAWTTIDLPNGFANQYVFDKLYVNGSNLYAVNTTGGISSDDQMVPSVMAASRNGGASWNTYNTNEGVAGSTITAASGGNGQVYVTTNAGLSVLTSS